MTAIRWTLWGLIGLAAGVNARAEEPEQKAHPPQVRIGVYDSRAIAVVAVGSEYYTQHIRPLEDAFRKAKAEGDAELIQELEPKVWARRKQTARQSFSTAPVDEMLAYIQADLPNIAAKAGVGPILSKWDKEALAKYPSAEQVDVTMLLVEAFKPKEKSLQWAIEVQQKPPVPLKELEEHLAQEGH